MGIEVCFRFANEDKGSRALVTDVSGEHSVVWLPSLSDSHVLNSYERCDGSRLLR